jgi:hypothetical protein
MVRRTTTWRRILDFGEREAHSTLKVCVFAFLTLIALTNRLCFRCWRLHTIQVIEIISLHPKTVVFLAAIRVERADGSKQLGLDGTVRREGRKTSEGSEGGVGPLRDGLCCLRESVSLMRAKRASCSEFVAVPAAPPTRASSISLSPPASWCRAMCGLRIRRNVRSRGGRRREQRLS